MASRAANQCMLKSYFSSFFLLPKVCSNIVRFSNNFYTKHQHFSGVVNLIFGFLTAITISAIVHKNTDSVAYEHRLQFLLHKPCPLCAVHGLKHGSARCLTVLLAHAIQPVQLYACALTRHVNICSMRGNSYYTCIIA